MTLLLAIILSTLAISALCSLFEAVLYSTRQGVLEAEAVSGRHAKAAQRMLGMKKNIAGPTAAILILNTIANTAGATLAGMVAGQILGTPGVVGVSVGLTLGILFFSEILPKTFGAVRWRNIWPYVVEPLVWMRRVLYPLIRIAQRFSEFFTGTDSIPVITEEEIRASIHMGRQEGQLTRDEQQLISAVFRFDEMVVRQILVPRREVEFLKLGWTLGQCRALLEQSGHTRYPVCAESLDDAIGVLHLKDLVHRDPESAFDLRELVRPLQTVPATMKISRLLRQMQRLRRHMALVVDEHGTALGIVTMENVLEQIVGGVQDEFDTEAPDIVPDGPNRFLVAGYVSIDRVNEQLKLDLYAPDADTVSGLLVSRAGRLLKTGDRIVLEGAVAEVVEQQGDRATRVRLVIGSETGETEEEADEPRGS